MNTDKSIIFGLTPGSCFENPTLGFEKVEIISNTFANIEVAKEGSSLKIYIYAIPNEKPKIAYGQ